MTPDERERFKLLCTQIPVEKDYNRYEQLLRDLYELVGRKERRFPAHTAKTMGAWKTIPAVAKQIIKSRFSNQPERVEISLQEADDLFREIRIENSFSNETGQSVGLVAGTALDVTFEASSKDTVRRNVNPGEK
jgi:chorismate mutase